MLGVPSPLHSHVLTHTPILGIPSSTHANTTKAPMHMPTLEAKAAPTPPFVSRNYPALLRRGITVVPPSLVAQPLRAGRPAASTQRGSSLRVSRPTVPAGLWTSCHSPLSAPPPSSPAASADRERDRQGDSAAAVIRRHRHRRGHPAAAAGARLPVLP